MRYLRPIHKHRIFYGNLYLWPCYFFVGIGDFLPGYKNCIRDRFLNIDCIIKEDWDTKTKTDRRSQLASPLPFLYFSVEKNWKATNTFTMCRETYTVSLGCR